MVHILLVIIIIHYIFLISFSTIKIFSFQSYYSNSHSLIDIIIMIIVRDVLQQGTKMQD